MRSRERRQAGHGGARVLWEARSRACGEAAGSATRESGARGRSSGRRPGAGGHRTSRGDCVARSKRLQRHSRFDKTGNADAKHKAAQLEAGRERDEDKDRED